MPSDTTSPTPGTNQSIIDQAKTAIKNGAPKDQVIKRLEDNGITDHGIV